MRPGWRLPRLLPIGIAPWLAAVLLAPACGHVLVPYHVSAPASLPPGVRGEIEDGRTTLHLEGLDLRVEARNPRASAVSLGVLMFVPFPLPAAGETTEEIQHKPLLVFLDLTPTERGQAFAPMAVRLTPAGGEPSGPVAYVGPGRSRGEVCLTADRAQLPRSVEERSFPLEPAKDPTCFVLRFERFLSPEDAFRLELGGLTRNGQARPLPALEFSKRRAYSFVAPRTLRPEAFE